MTLVNNYTQSVYSIIPGISKNTFEVQVTLWKNGSYSTAYLRTKVNNTVRTFTTRAAARKAISRALGHTTS